MNVSASLDWCLLDHTSAGEAAAACGNKRELSGHRHCGVSRLIRSGAEWQCGNIHFSGWFCLFSREAENLNHYLKFVNF